MNNIPLSLSDYTSRQLRNLCELFGTENSAETSVAMLQELLGPAGGRGLSEPALWPSEISDDMTPVEFSITFDENGDNAIRVLGETVAEEPDLRANVRVARRVIDSLADRFRLSLDRFHAIQDLFLPEQPQGKFALWYSMIVRPGSRPGFKVYFNPDARGARLAPQLVVEALRRLGFDSAYETATRHALQRGDLDRFSFFALDLADDPRSRVKIYISHHRAETTDVERAAGAVPGVDLARVRDLCSLVGGGSGPFIARPLLSGYTFVEGDADRPSVYSLYLPIRDYVCDDESARARVLAFLERHNFDPAVLDRALAAVARRPLCDGVGLIAHVALRLSAVWSGATVYLSSEAYGATPPRRPATHRPGYGERVIHRGGSHSVTKKRHVRKDAMSTFPPYRAQVVARIPITSRQERERALEQAGYNVFNLRANMVTIDLLTDSGTGAVSVAQEAAAVAGDRSYAGAESFYRFREAVSDLTPYPHILPVHQGRAAERILFSALLGPGQISISNTHFDTTRANVERIGAVARDLPCAEAKDLDSLEPFKGNIDLEALENVLTGQDSERVGLVMMTITNNGGGGQPVSMANLRAASRICRRHGVPLFLDAARFAENAWLVIQREKGYEQCTPREVARLAFQLAEGCVASLKKDGISPMGAFIGLRDAALARRCEIDLITTEGFRTYGGLATHELERLAQGLGEVLDPHYLRARESDAVHLARLVCDAGVNIVQPPGIHAIYLNAGRLLRHLPARHFPGHALACELYLEGGIRCVELGSLYLGELDGSNDLVNPAPYELVRLALPRRVYTRSHMEYVGEVLTSIAEYPERVPGYRIVEAPPTLRHFNLRMKPLSVTAPTVKPPILEDVQDLSVGNSAPLGDPL